MRLTRASAGESIISKERILPESSCRQQDVGIPAPSLICDAMKNTQGLPEEIERWRKVISMIVSRCKKRKDMAGTLGQDTDIFQTAALAIWNVYMSGKFPKKEPDSSRYMYVRAMNAVREERERSRIIRVPRCNKKMAEALKRSEVAIAPGISGLLDSVIFAPIHPAEVSPELVRDIADCLNRMSKKSRQVLCHLYGLEGHVKMGAKELASRLGVTQETITKKHYDCKMLFRAMFRREPGS